MDIKISNLSKIYNNQIVLNIEQLDICKGEFVGLVGNNGAGKTTLLRILIDLLKPNSGAVYINEKEISRKEDWKRFTSAYYGENFLIDFFTPEEYFSFIASNYSISKDDFEGILSDLEYFMNGEILNKQKYIRDHSSGNKQKIGIIGAIICKPQIMLLDEPFNFLDPTSQSLIANYLLKLNEQSKTTIILSSHNLECISNISSRIILLEKGLIIKDIQSTDSEFGAELRSYFNEVLIRNTNKF